MQTEEQKQRLTLLGIMALPVVVFYAILLRLAQNLPLYDDYDAGLLFAMRLLQRPAGVGRWLYLAEAQQNEYKIYLGHAFVWAELKLFGHIDFRVLSICGDLFVLLLLYVLWKLFLPNEQDKTRRLALFLPVPFLIAQMQYWETLNWPLPGLQNLPILGFSLAAIYLLGRGTDRAWWGAAAAMVLAISASGNGFLLLPIGLLMLLVSRRWVGLLGWVATGAATIWVYSYHYATMTQKAGHGSMITALMHPRLLFIMVFMGAAGASPLPKGAYPAGLAIVCVMVWMIVRGYPRRNPVVCYCALFCILTAIGVAGIRADSAGLASSLSSRYRMYSDLLVVFCWFALAEEFLQRKVGVVWRTTAYRVAMGVAVLFWFGNTVQGAKSMRVRDRWTAHGVALYEHPEQPAAQADGPVYVDPHNDEAVWVAFEVRARRILNDSRAMGVYEPPKY